MVRKSDPAPEPVRWHPERGAGRAKALLFTLILIIAIYVGIKEVPPRFNDYQLEDKIREEAIFAAANRKTADDVRKDIFEKIQDLGIPAKKEDIKVELNSRGCTISVDYTVPIDLLLYQHDLQFHTTTENRSL